jgi:hypothetical protein
MGRKDRNGFSRDCVDPSGGCPATGKNQSVSAAVVDNSQFQAAIFWCAGDGLPHLLFSIRK